MLYGSSKKQAMSLQAFRMATGLLKWCWKNLRYRILSELAENGEE